MTLGLALQQADRGEDGRLDPSLRRHDPDQRLQPQVFPEQFQ
jgi:hypothetical protein